MKILELKLKGYKRLDLLGVENLTYTPQSPYQLILGTNGAGKSSIMNELSPLPIESNALREGGYKKIKIEHRDSLYQLDYTLHKKLECSFIKDGKELNDGGTIKVQKDLIQEHFHYDNHVHDILIGFTLLSNMSPMQRREWFVKMSRADMTYALGVFGRLKSAERDIKGAVKLNNQRLVTEMTKLPSQDDIQRIRREDEKLKHELNHLLPFSEQGLMDYTERLNDLLKQLESLSSEFMDLKFNLVYDNQYHFRDTELLEDILNHLKYQEVEVKNDYRKSVSELAELQDIFLKSKQLTEKPLEVIDNDIANVKSKLHQLQQDVTAFGIEVGENPSEELFQFRHMDGLKSLLMTFPSNPTTETGRRLFSRTEYESILTAIQETKQTVIEHQNRLHYLEKEHTHLTDVHDVNCPNCQHTFKPGVDCTRLDELNQRIPKEKTSLMELERKLSTLESERAKYEDWITAMKQFRGLQERFPIYNKLFQLIQLDDRFHDYPSGLVKVVDDYHRVLVLSASIKDGYKRLSELEEERIRRVAAEGQDTEYILTRMTQLENHIKEVDIKSKDIIRRIQELEKVLSSGYSMLEKCNAIKTLYNDIHECTYQQVRYENNQKLQAIISTKQVQLANNDQFVKAVNQSETIVSQLTETIDTLTAEQKALSILTTLLSPQDGLIAESLIGFLNQFLNQMGNILDQIWMYEMRPYLDLDEEGIELDYRFKVDIEGLEEPVSDVSRLSRGQKEIVDFVFKLLLMQYLDMQDYPLFMDEVGGTFDATHRDSLYRYIKLLVESNQTQQVFIISHIASSHNALSTADKCVLDANAKMVDSEVNQVFILE